MSAKICSYSSKYKTLVLSKRSQLDDSAFNEWINSHFSNPSLAISQTRSGDVFLSDHEVTNKRLNQSPQKIDSIKSYFVNNSKAYNDCIKHFSNAIVENTLYNANTNEWIDAEAEFANGINVLNANLFKYKIDLINAIRNEIPNLTSINLDVTSENADQLLTDYIYDTLNAVDEFGGEVSTEMYSNYVILKNFNRLLSEKTPFISIKPEYKNTLTHGVNMYNYDGPTVKHRVSWTTNEHVSAKSQYSDLANILLNYLQESDETGTSIPNTSIGVDGFTNIMNRFKTALLYSEALQEHRQRFFDGGFNITDALEEYLSMIEYNSRAGVGSDNEYITTQLKKLRGIINNIFKSGLSQDVKEMFEGMFYKTVPLSYITYAFRNGTFGRINLKDSWVNTQMLNLQDTINGAVKKFRQNPNLFAKLKEKWGIVVRPNNTNVISFDSKDKSLVGRITYDTESKNNYVNFDVNASSMNFVSEVALKEFLMDLLEVYLPTEDYSEISKMVNKGGSLMNDFKEIISMILLSVEPNSNFAPFNIQTKKINFRQLFLFDKLRPAANTLSLIYGTEIRNVVNNVNGDKLPTNGLTSLIQNTPKLGAYLSKLDIDDPHFTLFNNSFLAPKRQLDRYGNEFGGYSAPGWLTPLVRQGVRIGNQTKQVAQLTLPELLEIAITYDFLDPVLSGDNVIYLQNAQFADKERQWVIPFLMQQIAVDGKEYSMKDIITNVALGKQSSDDLIEIWQKLRKSRYDAFESNLVYDYNQVFETSFNTLAEVDKYLEEKKYSIDELNAIFQMDKNELTRIWKKRSPNLTDDEIKIRLDALFDGREGKVQFIKETTASEKNKIARINETELHYISTFKTLDSAKLRLKKSRAFFAKDLFKGRLKLNKHTNTTIANAWNKITDDWKETRGDIETGNIILFKVYKNGKQIEINAGNQSEITNSENTVVLNPILESYLLSDIIYSNEFNFLNTGDVFGHPSKSSNSDTNDNGFGSSAYYDSSEASRLVAMNKRAVIYGGAIHSFNHNLANNRGTNKIINIAVIKDPSAPVWNLMGGLKSDSVDDGQDVFDGAGFMSIYQAIFEQQSLKDAAVGVNEKTILGWNHKYYGTQILLKWAVYAITNETRRISRNSTIKGEQLFKKLHSAQFYKDLNMYDIWRQYVTNDLFIKDYESRKHYKILGVQTINQPDGKVLYARVATEVSQDGEIINSQNRVYLTNRNKIVDINSELNDSDFTYNTIYDLDQFFGGCDEESLVNNTLAYTTRGNNIVADIICDYDLKDYFISYLVNESAIKSGASNLNSEEKYYNDDAFNTMEMSTEYGGLQMDAEHELDDSEVTEMTQMISALIEKGWNYELVNQIYKDIGSVVLESLKTIKSAIKTTPDQLKLIFGKALIESYAKGDRDTLGLAQSFLSRAERLLRESNIDFKFPFSGATINGSFIATVSSLLTKRAIRRKYAGVAAVLNPGHDMIQVYGGNNTMMNESYSDYIDTWRKNSLVYKNTSINDLINKLYVTNDLGVQTLNPFCEEITNDKTKFTFEDTIVVEEAVKDPSGLDLIRLKPVVIDGYKNYDYYKQEYKGRIWIWKSRPRNLRCSNTTFYRGTKQFSVYDTTAVRAANKSILKNWNQTDSKLIFDTLKHGILTYGGDVITYRDPDLIDIDLTPYINNQNRDELNKIIDIRRTLYNIVQNQMDALNNGWFNDVYLTAGRRESVSNVNVSAAEIVLGKMYAKQFGLRKGDDISQILRDPDFFYNRMSGNYELPQIDSRLYDAVLFTKNGEKVLVKLNKDLEYDFDKATNPNIIKVDGKVYLNDEELTSDQGKEFYQIEAGNELYNVVVINDTERLSELINSQQVVQYKLNYDGDSQNALNLAYEIYDSFETIDKEGNRFTFGTFELANYNDLEKLALIKESEEYAFNRRLRKQSELMKESFKLSLNFIGTRIPAQAMQSFQPMKVVGFTDDEVNNVYVNRHNFYLEGSDMDIDKTYMLGYEVNSSGIVETGSKLAKRFGIIKALQLSLAKGRTFKEGKNGIVIDVDTINEALSGNISVINQILDNGNTTLTFIQPHVEGNNSEEVNDQVNAMLLKGFDDKKEQLIKLLNLHESSYVSESALKNRVTYQMWQVATNPRNQLNLHSPINMETQRDAAKKSELSKDEANINIDTPSAKYMMQEQNMVGKACIGITAVAIKCFFAKSAYVNGMLNTIPTSNASDIISILNSLTYDNPITKKLTILANVNLKDVIERLTNDYIDLTDNISDRLKIFVENGKFNLKRCLKYLQRVSNRVDCAMELSGLLSAATDNAKELILSKINATSKLIDIYTVGLQSGCTFDEISDIMTSPIVNAVVRLADNNIFKSYQKTYKLKDAIDFYLNVSFLPGVRKSFLLNYARKSSNNQNLDENELLKNLTDNKFVEKMLTSQIYPALKAFGATSGDVDAELNEFAEGTNKITKSDLLAIADFLEECIDRNLTLQELRTRKYSGNQKNYIDQLSDLRLIRTKFIPAAEEQQILGNMLKINQGLVTNAHAQYSLIKRIENFVTERIGQPFDLMSFINDSEYRQKAIDLYEKEKSTINILAVISSVPHFAEMFNVLYDNNFILRKLSVRYDLSVDIAREINPKFTVNENEFRQIGHYVNDMFIVSYLTNLDKSITIPEGVLWYDNTTEGKPAIKSNRITLKTLYDLASFKSYMENYVIPALKEDVNYRNNSFIINLSRSETEDRITKKDKSYYKLPLNMMTIDESSDSKDRYESILAGFNQIAKNTFEGWTIADLFFVYNAIVNKDGFGQTSMTRIFEDLVDSNNSSLVSGFYEYIAQIDDDPNVRQEFKKKLNQNDIKFYIKSNVRGSYISSNAVFDGDENFTFPMPELVGNFIANKPDVDGLNENQTRYSYKLDDRSLIQELVTSLASKYGKDNIEIHGARWFEKYIPGAENKNGFIFDGKVYINLDLASFSTVLHEYVHLILSTMKFNPEKKDLYYSLVSSVRTNPEYERYATQYRDAGFIGSDLEEEIFANILENYFNNKIQANWTGYQILESNRGSFLEALQDLFESNIDQSVPLEVLMKSNPATIIKTFGSRLIDPNYDFDLDQISIKWRLATDSEKYRMLDAKEVTAKCD